MYCEKEKEGENFEISESLFLFSPIFYMQHNI